MTRKRRGNSLPPNTHAMQVLGYNPRSLPGGLAVVQLDILYPHLIDCRFDFDYYVKTHMPLARRLLGDACKGVRIQPA